MVTKGFEKSKIEDINKIIDTTQYNYTLDNIHSKLDRLTDENQRRFEGEFYTPLPFAKKAIHYLGKVLGKNWYKTGKYRVWDMAAGIGNLEYHLPAEAYKYLYMSTLHASEAEYLNKTFRGATCFQYDYLNDDVEYLLTKHLMPFDPNWKLPKKLRKDLKNPSITWLIYINPPFATAQVAGSKGTSKKEVSKTKIEILMDKAKVGHAKRELFAQFMYRIVHEMPKNTYLAMFSTLKYINAPDTIKFRNDYFYKKYEKGFVFHSKNFHGITGNFPIGFLIWNLSKPPEKNVVSLDVVNNEAQTVGVKQLKLIQKNEVINKWFHRPPNSNDYILPPLSNGINVKAKNSDKRHRARPDFLASICSKGNDFQNSKYVTILSSPSVSAGAFTVNKVVFEKALVLHAVRKIPKPTWLNDRDQFLIPHTSPNEEFINDCVIWSLFATSNQTTALKDVEYLGKTYQIKNNFYPFQLEELKKWNIQDPDFKIELRNDEDRFVAKWIAQKTLSKAAQTVLDLGREVYHFFYDNLNHLSTHELKIQTWDVGWYQIRKCLQNHYLGIEEMENLKEAHQKLGQKILPLIEAFGFLNKEEIYEPL